MYTGGRLIMPLNTRFDDISLDTSTSPKRLLLPVRRKLHRHPWHIGVLVQQSCPSHGPTTAHHCLGLDWQLATKSPLSTMTSWKQRRLCGLTVCSGWRGTANRSGTATQVISNILDMAATAAHFLYHDPVLSVDHGRFPVFGH